MNNILKGFSSLFNWIFPSKTYQELSYDLDNKTQDLYDKHIKYPYISTNNPCSVSYSSNLAADITRAIEKIESET